MLVGILMLGKRYKLLDYAAVVLLTIGLTLFALADKAVRPAADAASCTRHDRWRGLGGASQRVCPVQVSPEFSPLGVILISSALAADAVIGNLQERVYGRFRCDPLEMVVWTKLVGTLYLCGIALATGQLSAGLHRVATHPPAALRMIAFSGFGLLGEVCVRGCAACPSTRACF